MSYAPLEMSAALYGLLSGDATLSALVDGVFNGIAPVDYVERTGEFLYVQLGQDNCSADDDKTATGWTMNITVDIFQRRTNDKSFLPSLKVANRIYDLMMRNEGAFDMDHATCYLIQRTSQNNLVEPDGSLHVSMNFDAYLKEC